MSFERFRRFPVGFVYSICPNTEKENSQEALGIRNAFSYVDIGRIEGSNPKAIMKFLIQT